MRPSHWKHTTIAFITLLTLIGTAPAMAAPAAMKVRAVKDEARSARAKAQPRGAGGLWVKPPEKTAPVEAAPAEAAAHEAAPASPAQSQKATLGLRDRLFSMRTSTQVSIAKAKVAQLEGKFGEAAEHLNSVEPQSMRERSALKRAGGKLEGAFQAEMKLQVAEQAKADRALDQSARGPKQPGILKRNLTARTEVKEALADAREAMANGSLRYAQAALEQVAPRGLVERFKVWRATRALRKAATKQAMALVESGEFRRGLAALQVAEAQTSDTMVGRFLANRAQNKVHNKAMAVAAEAAKDTTDPNSFELVQAAIEAAAQTGSGKFDGRAANKIVARAAGNHIQAYVNAAERMMNEGNGEYAQNLLEQAFDHSTSGNFPRPRSAQMRRMNQLAAKIEEKLAAGERGVTYREIEPAADLVKAIPEAIALAKTEGRPVMTTVNGQQVTFHGDEEPAKAVEQLTGHKPEAIKIAPSKADTTKVEPAAVEKASHEIAPADPAQHAGAIKATGAAYWKPRSNSTLSSSVSTMFKKSKELGQPVATYFGGHLLSVDAKQPDAINQALLDYHERL